MARRLFVAVCHVRTSPDHPQPRRFSSNRRTETRCQLAICKGTAVPPRWAFNAGSESNVFLKPIISLVAQLCLLAITPYSQLSCAPASTLLHQRRRRRAITGAPKQCSMMPAAMPFSARLPSKRSSCSPPRSQTQTEDITIASQSRPSPHASFPLHFDVVEARCCCNCAVEFHRKPWFAHSIRVGLHHPGKLQNVPVPAYNLRVPPGPRALRSDPPCVC